MVSTSLTTPKERPIRVFGILKDYSYKFVILYISFKQLAIKNIF